MQFYICVLEYLVICIRKDLRERIHTYPLYKSDVDS